MEGIEVGSLTIFELRKLNPSYVPKDEELILAQEPLQNIFYIFLPL
ncbi:MAG: hypothetical protein ACP5O8_02115 [Candidatus Aenigmatarchaeota archaeon]